MNSIIIFELRTLLNIKKILVIIFSILVGVFVGIVFLKDVTADKVLTDGNINIVKGNEAIELLREYDKDSIGYITPEKLLYARNIFNSSYDEKKDKMIITNNLW